MSTINTILKKLNFKLIKLNTDYDKKLNLYEKIIISHVKVEKSSIGTIIFSMDRAMQLDALLRSFLLNKIGDCKIIVIYKVSNDKHKKAYSEVVKRFNDAVIFREEDTSPFKNLVLQCVDEINTDKIFFLVDDLVFTHKIDFNDLVKVDTNKYIFSLRMGEHLNFSYVVNKTQKLPKFIKKDKNYIYWKWGDSELDWAYPLSVDGHIFNRLEIKSLIEFCDFKAPNSLENSLQVEKELFSYKIGMSCTQASIVNNPCNKVQDEIDNLYGLMHQNDLLKIWQDKKQIDIRKFQGHVNKSVHEYIEFEFENRDEC
jgi:hypothetical protein